MSPLQTTYVLSQLRSLLSEGNYSRAVILMDMHTETFCWPTLQPHLPPHFTQHILCIPSGEEHKNLTTYSRLIRRMTDLECDRKTLLIALGGGVVCDLGGFVAASYKRGIDCMLIPTTLLAMVDAAWGGKTGIDFDGIKNHLGVFSPPKSVFLETSFLQSLPPQERLSGFAEVLKTALLSSSDFVDEVLQLNPVADPIPETLIRRCIAKKMDIVEQDPLEKNIRKILNLGHTLGHVFESIALQKKQAIPHGNAVAWGLLGELFLSEQQLGFPTSLRLAIEQFVRHYYPPLFWDETDAERFLPLLTQDKKTEKNQIYPILLSQPGLSFYDQACPLTAWDDVWAYYRRIGL